MMISCVIADDDGGGGRTQLYLAEAYRFYGDTREREREREREGD